MKKLLYKIYTLVLIGLVFSQGTFLVLAQTPASSNNIGNTAVDYGKCFAMNELIKKAEDDAKKVAQKAIDEAKKKVENKVSEFLGNAVPIKNDDITKTEENTKTTKEKEIQQEKKAEETIRKARKNECFKKIAQKVLVKMTERTVNWALTGFKGDPFYIRNDQSFIKSIDDQLLEGTVQDITRCTNGQCPFGKDIAKSLIRAYRSENQPTNQSKFTLDKVIGSDANEFQKDFSKGGWAGWEAYTQNPYNNALGSYLETSIELSNKRTQKKEELRQELLQNNGFLSLRKCVEYKENVNSKTGNYTFTDNGQTYACSKKPDPNIWKCASKDIETNPPCFGPNLKKSAFIDQYCTDPKNNNGTLGAGYVVGEQKIDTCARYEVTTPGSIIREQLTKAVNAPFEKKQSEAETGSEHIDQLANLATDLISKGLGKLGTLVISGSNGANNSDGGLGSNATIFTNSNTNAWASGQVNPEYRFKLENSAIPGTPGIDLSSAIIYINREIQALNNQKNLLKTFSAKTQLLDQCLPGPDVGWAQRFDTAYANATASIRTISENPVTPTPFNIFDVLNQRNAVTAINRIDTYSQSDLDDITNEIENVLPSSGLFINQINKQGQYNADIKNIEAEILAKKDILLKLNSIKSKIAAYPGSISGGVFTANPLQNINGLTSTFSSVYQYVSDDSSARSAEDKLVEYQAENDAVFDTTNSGSLLRTCIQERSALSAATIAEDQGQTLFCSWQNKQDGTNTNSGIFGDPIVPKKVGAGYTQNFNPYIVNQNIPIPLPVQLNCSDFYKASLSDYENL